MEPTLRGGSATDGAAGAGSVVTGVGIYVLDLELTRAAAELDLMNEEFRTRVLPLATELHPDADDVIRALWTRLKTWESTGWRASPEAADVLRRSGATLSAAIAQLLDRPELTEGADAEGHDACRGKDSDPDAHDAAQVAAKTAQEQLATTTKQSPPRTCRAGGVGGALVRCSMQAWRSVQRDAWSACERQKQQRQQSFCNDSPSAELVQMVGSRRWVACVVIQCPRRS